MPKNDLKTLHALIRGSYSSKWDADTDAACKATLTQMLADKGEHRTAEAVHRLIQTEKFWTPAALWNLVPASGPLERTTCPRCAEFGGFYRNDNLRDGDGRQYSGLSHCDHNEAA